VSGRTLTDVAVKNAVSGLKFQDVEPRVPMLTVRRVVSVRPVIERPCASEVAMSPAVIVICADAAFITPIAKHNAAQLRKVFIRVSSDWIGKTVV
jgi:hypothetical protein